MGSSTRSNRRRWAALALLCVLALAGVAAGCGESEDKEVVEGEPLELGDLSFNVVFTRFLNPTDREDSEYLEGQPPLGDGKAYLAVFMTVENEGDETETLPRTDQMEVVDTTGATFSPQPADGLFGLDFGGEIGPDEEIPLLDTAAAAGPIKGAMVLFEVDNGVTESRPLQLEISSGSDEGQVELDI